MRKWLWLLFFPLVAQAAGGGAWQASSMGVTLSNRGVAMSSNPLAPAEEVSGLMGLVVWNYRQRACGCASALRRAARKSTAKMEQRRRSTACRLLNLCVSSGKCRAGDV